MLNLDFFIKLLESSGVSAILGYSIHIYDYIFLKIPPSQLHPNMHIVTYDPKIQRKKTSNQPFSNKPFPTPYQKPPSLPYPSFSRFKFDVFTHVPTTPSPIPSGSPQLSRFHEFKELQHPRQPRIMSMLKMEKNTFKATDRMRGEGNTKMWERKERNLFWCFVQLTFLFWSLSLAWFMAITFWLLYQKITYC